MKRWFIVGLALVFPLVLVAVGVAELRAPRELVSLPEVAPEGIVLDKFGGPRELLSESMYERFGIYYELADNPKTGLSVAVSNFPSVALRRLFSYLNIPPSPSFPHYELGVDSPELPGIGLGDDVIQCGNGQPEKCFAWSYWGQHGKQLLTVALYGDTRSEPMTPDEFRDLVRELFSD